MAQQLRGASDQGWGGGDKLGAGVHFQGVRDYGRRGAPSTEKTERGGGDFSLLSMRI